MINDCSWYWKVVSLNAVFAKTLTKRSISKLSKIGEPSSPRWGSIPYKKALPLWQISKRGTSFTKQRPRLPVWYQVSSHKLRWQLELAFTLPSLAGHSSTAPSFMACAFICYILRRQTPSTAVRQFCPNFVMNILLSRARALVFCLEISGRPKYHLSEFHELYLC